MAKVVWTRRAIADLVAIRAYVGQFSPIAAHRLAVRLREAADGLGSLPERGRPIGRRRRELTAISPYLIRYRIEPGRIEIIAIRHGARGAN